MKFLLSSLLGIIGCSPKVDVPCTQKSLYEFQVKSIDHHDISLEKYKGKVLLFVNVASKCAFTPQYGELEKLYQKYKDQGLVVLGFPANNFLWQEPGDNQTIANFCSTKYNVSFPMFSKISVKGSDIHPLYQFLTMKKNNQNLDAPIKWNFQKIIVNRSGKVVQSISPRASVFDPGSLKIIEDLLNEK